MEILTILAIFYLGTIIGSFLNVLILRLPRENSILGRSECPSCHASLKSRDLIPLFSFLLLKGKCRSCSAKISSRYFLIELLTGALFTVAFSVIDPSTLIGYFETLRAWFILAVLVVVFVIDFEHFLILDKIIFPSTLALLGLNIVSDLLSSNSLLSLSSLTLSGLLAAALTAGAFYLLWLFSRGRWIGFGDVKLMSFLGLALAIPQIFVGLFIAFVSGGLLGVLLLATGQKKMQSKLPLGTFLSVGSALALLWGHGLLHWYLSLIGLA